MEDEEKEKYLKNDKAQRVIIVINMVILKEIFMQK
jgi:hypothetical protein